MNEPQTRLELIDTALRAAGWGVVEDSRILVEHPVTIGRLIGYGKRAKPMKADYVLQYKGRKLAVVEAKSDEKYYTEGVAQAKTYAEKLQIRFTYSTNGRKNYGIDMQLGKEGDVASFPSPDELWAMTFAEENYWRDKLLSFPYKDKGEAWQIRYYQDIAVTRVIEAITKGQNRILLTLATGTGKTSIAFQIAWKLFQGRWNIKDDGKRLPRILFLADRNILASQAFNDFNSFSAFEEEALVRIKPDSIRKKGVPKNGSVFFTIFQTFMSGENDSPYFGDYPNDFFDFIIIDECHRGGANDESTWRDIMDYFSPAVQLGLTATPKRDKNIDTYRYFGEPVYIYSLKEGINDGFLTPFKVKQIDTTIDEYVYTSDDEVIEGDIEEGKRYTEQDFNRIIEIKQREEYRVKIFMDMMDQTQKTIVFCASQPHALAIRDLINQNKKSKNPDYCHRVTADDGALGEQYLSNFQDNEKSIPTVLTTSQKLSTGVDARQIRNIVLLRPINSMVEFKQIVGRGTRLFDGKDYFTIYDFVKAHHHFADKEWDGEPEEPEGGEDNSSARPPRPYTPLEGGDTTGEPPVPINKITKVRLPNGKVMEFQHMVKTSFWSPDGRPISLEEFLQSLFNTLPEHFKSENELRNLWSKPATRKELLNELSNKGFKTEQLREFQQIIKAENSDLYDVLSYIAFHAEPIARSQRAEKAREHFELYDTKQQKFLDFVLQQYVRSGFEQLDDAKLSNLLKLKYRSIADAKKELGNTSKIRDTFIGFQGYLY